MVLHHSNVTTTSSDHYPLWLTCKLAMNVQRSPHRFKFENSWLVEPKFSQMLKQQWQTYIESGITQKLSNCANDLAQWNRSNNKVRGEINQVQKKLERIRTHVSASNVNYYNALRRKLDKLLVQDDLFWKQRAKTFWYRDGDLNTKFFHVVASSRRKVNRIEHLKDNNGMICRKEEELRVITCDYFVQLFTKFPSTRDTDVSKIQTSINHEDNISLIADFTIDEFRAAVFSMQADKCLGSDGFNLGFYHHFWDMCGQEVFQAGREWLANGMFPLI